MVAITRAVPFGLRPEKTIVGVGPMKANRSIRAQELSVVRRANVDIVPAPARKKVIGA